MKQKKKRVSLIAKVFITAFAVYAACTLVSLQLRISAKAAEQATLQDKLEEQKLTNAELSDAITESNNEDYIAKVARESLDYVFPGEQVYVDTSSK